VDGACEVELIVQEPILQIRGATVVGRGVPCDDMADDAGSRMAIVFHISLATTTIIVCNCCSALATICGLVTCVALFVSAMMC
jgi:hypothetical protein